MPVLTRPELLERRARGRIGETWVGTLEDGTPVAVKRVTVADERDRDLLLKAVDRLSTLRHPSLVSVRGAFVEDAIVRIVSDFDPGISLRRLLAVARLSSEQATAIACGLRAGLDALHGAGNAHGALHADNVRIGVDGTVRLADGGLWSRAVDLSGERAKDLEAARRLEQVLGIPETAEGAGTRDEPGSGVASQLASLVSLIGPERPRVRGAIEHRAPASEAKTFTAPIWRRKRRPLRVSAVILLMLLVAGVAWQLSLRHLGIAQAPHGRLPAAGAPTARSSPSPSGRPAASPAGTPVPAPRAVPVLGPSSAGDVTAVNLYVAQGPCLPGQSCKLGVQVNLAPRTTSEEVDFALVLFDRCSGDSREEPGLSVTATPDWSFVYRRWWVTMPATRSLAVIAVTSAPVRAASSPLLVGDTC